MGSKKGGQQQRVYDYYLSIHQGICTGPVDAIKRIIIGEKEAWPGNDDDDALAFGQSSNGVLSINKPDLFGGPQKEGGVVGKISVLLGGGDQTLSDLLAGKLKSGLTALTAPGFRGLTSLFFYGSATSGNLKGFLWGTNTPYIKPVWVTVYRKSPGLDPTKAVIESSYEATVEKSSGGGFFGGGGPPPEETKTIHVYDSNPANIIYDCLSNTDWGMGASPNILDIGSFTSAQAKLFTEDFGLSMIWTKQQTIENFISEVLDHINATLFINPQTGLLTLTLIRDDYDPDVLESINPNNAQITSFQRRLWGETINEIIVSWSNPASEDEETVNAQDPANISIQGGIISDSRDYYGVRNGALAMKLAIRDVRLSSAPLISAEVVLDRRFWKILPGGVIKLSWPEQGLIEMVMRIMKVDYGKPGDSKIKASLIEDIFAFEPGAFITPPPREWRDPSKDPEQIQFQKFLTLPYVLTEAVLGTTQIAGLEYPEAITGVLALAPNNDTFQYKLMAEGPNPDGGLAYKLVDYLVPVSGADLAVALPFAAQNTGVLFPNIKGGNDPVVGGFVIFGAMNRPDNQTEIALVLSGDNLIGYTLRRGVLDTIPRAWPIGTPSWFVVPAEPIADPTIRSAGQNINYKLVDITSLGSMPIDDVLVRTMTVSDRPHLPIRPANVKANSDGLGPIHVSETDAVVAVTWANRNRFEESVPLQAWDAVTISPEDGQNTSIFVELEDGTLITAHEGLSGTSFDVPLASFSTEGQAWIRVAAVRDGLESFQNHRIKVLIDERTGFGFDFGFNFGGAL
jgi:hypothetical protein